MQPKLKKEKFCMIAPQKRDLFRLICQGLFNDKTIFDCCSFNLVDDDTIILYKLFKTNSTITSVNIAKNKFTSIGLGKLVDGIKLNSSISALSFANNKYINKWTHIDDLLQHNLENLHYLNLNHTPIHLNNGISHIMNGLAHNTFLTTISLNNCCMGNNCHIIPIANMLKTNKTLCSLSLENNNITENGMKIIAESLKSNNTLKDLRLCGNTKAKTNGLISMASMLRENKTLERVSLSNFFPTYKPSCDNKHGIMEVMKALELYNRSLKVLLFDDNYLLNTQDAMCIQKMLFKNTTLTILSLSGNNIETSMFRIIVKGLKNNTTLYTLNCSNNRICLQGLKTLEKILQNNENTSLTEACFYRNKMHTRNQKRLNPLLNRNMMAVEKARKAALYVVALRDNTNAYKGLQSLPKEISTIIAKNVWKTRGQKCWV